jgi:flavin-dependent dehydrogenase
MRTHPDKIGTNVSWYIHPDCVGNGYFLLGDAASVLDPLSSHGVLRAMMSGMLISRHSHSVENASDMIEKYRSWLTRQFNADVDGLRALYRRHPFGIVADMFDEPNMTSKSRAPRVAG